MLDYMLSGPVSASPLLMTGLVLLMVIDYMTGTLAAVVLRELSSKRSWRGVAQKTLIVLLLVAVAVVEQVVREMEGVPQLPYLRLATLGFIGAEFMSVLENVTRAGVVPRPVRPLLEKLSGYFK